MRRSVAVEARRRALTDEQQRMARTLRESLTATPRAIPPLFFYDALGSALFDAICELPWYNVTRSETALIEAHACEIGRIAAPTRLVELGPGNGRKAAALARGLGIPGLNVHLVDISASALALARATVSTVHGVHVTTHSTTYEAGLAALQRDDASGVDGGRGGLEGAAGPTLVAFLGSNIGNFDPEGARRFLALIRAAIGSGDSLLLGADLVKSERDILLAYDDPLGVTAAFNRNALQHINRELDANFDLGAFAHMARWRPDASRVEMHLVSLCRQVVTIDATDFRFTLEPGEPIWTESSYKYEPEGIVSLVESAGFRTAAQWVDPVHRFALTLFHRQG